MDDNEIIKSMKAELVVKENEFNQIIAETKKLDSDYTLRKQQLDDAREQIRGAYTALYMQLQKFGVNVETTTTTSEQTPKQESIQTTADEEIKKDVKSKTTKSSKQKKDESKTEKVVAGLTPDEIAKINQAVPFKDATDENGNVIPEYLQSEYNK